MNTSVIEMVIVIDIPMMIWIFGVPDEFPLFVPVPGAIVRDDVGSMLDVLGTTGRPVGVTQVLNSA